MSRHAPDVESQRVTLTALVGDTSTASWSWVRLIEELLALGRTDVPLARLGEGHIDAVRILDQAGREPVPSALYGVWAPRSRETGCRRRWTAATS